MNWKQSVIRSILIAAAMRASTQLGWAQSCNCRSPISDPGTSGAANPIEAENSAIPQTSSKTLPKDWPKQWSEPLKPTASKKTTIATPKAEQLVQTQVRDPFTGKMVASTAQMRWDRAITTSLAASNHSETPTSPAISPSQRNTQSAEGTQSAGVDAKKSYSILPSQSGSAVGGVIGGGGSGGAFGNASGGIGGSMGGGSGGAVNGGTSSWSPRSGGAGGGASAGGASAGSASAGGSSSRSNSGTLSVQANGDKNSDSSNSDPQTSTNSTNNTGTNTNTAGADSSSGSTSTSTTTNSEVETDSTTKDGSSSVIADPSHDIPVVSGPEVQIPDFTPEVPAEEDPSPSAGSGPGTCNGETPIVPEPGGIILLGIALAGAGAIHFRRRRQGLLKKMALVPAAAPFAHPAGIFSTTPSV